MTHPYEEQPNSSFWRKFVSVTAWRELNINNNVKFQIEPESKISTAGSCFAQHIARYFKKVGIEIYNAEPAHAIMHEFGDFTDSYNRFSARYGNIYTSRQLAELLMQSVGQQPMISDFTQDNGRWYDLLRPNVEKEGFSSLSEAEADRRYHLGRVQEMFINTDVFILTLGLTECWYHKDMGHTYPACPGTVRGEFNPEKHLFKKLSYLEIMDDMKKILDILKIINKRLKIIISVSPIPLIATRTTENVLIASSHSKSVLRAVAGDLHDQYENLAYFPSYEIINNVCSFGQYLASDLREVTERGVSHVMDVFLNSFFKNLPTMNTNPNIFYKKTGDNQMHEAPIPPVECEEVFNQNKFDSD